jgi:hypothetical protein
MKRAYDFNDAKPYKECPFHPIVRATTTLPRVHMGARAIQYKTKQHYGTEYHPPTHPMKHTSLVLSAERTRAHATSNFVSMDYIYLHTQKRVLRDRSPRRQTRGRLDDDALTKFHHAEMDCQVSDDSFLPSKPFEYNIITDARGTTQQSWDMPLG